MKVKQTSCKKDSHEKSIRTKFKVGKSVKACKTDIEDISADDSVNQIFNDGLNFVDVADTIDFLDDDFIDLNVICYFCQNSYDSKIKLNQHIIKKHKNDVETCELCRISFIDKSSLDTHKNKHITRKQNVLKCSLCPQAFFNRPKLIYHEYNHGADRIDNGLPLENDNICSVVLPNNTNDFVDFENLFTCDLCSKSFKKLPSLNRHRLLHEKAKVANCKSVETKIVYADSSQSQPVLKFLHCKYCIKLFANNETLERHVALHELNERKKKYVCKYCQKRYMMPAMLFSHFRKSHKFETPFSCLYCDKYFSRRQEFSLHIKHLHQNSGTIKFDSNYSIVYGTTFIPSDDHFQNMTFDIHNSALDSCFHETRFLDVNTDDFIDLDSSNLEEISLDTDCFNTEKNNDFDSMIANMETNADNDNYVVFNDDILDILESAKSDELLKDNCESVIPLDEVMLPNIIKDSTSNYEKVNDKDVSKGEDCEKDGEMASCEVCGVTLKKQSLKSHVSLHYNRSSQKYKCHLCSMSFRTKVKLDLHIKDHFQNDKKLCICGVKCDSSDSLMKHKEQCLKTFFTFEPNIKTNKTTISNKGCDVDPLNDNNIVIFNAEENSCVILEDSVENRNYIKDSNSIKNICKSLEVASTSSNYIQPTPLLFRKPIEAPSPKVIIKRITQEEAALKKKIIIKATPMQEKNSFATESQMLPKLVISQIPAAVCLADAEVDNERILVNVNPLAHLLPVKDPSASKKKSSKSQKLDYASIIEKSLTSILHIKRME